MLRTDPVGRLTANGNWFGEAITSFIAGTSVMGSVYYLASSGAWTLTDADFAANSRNLLGIAVSSDGFDLGVMIRGFFKNTAWSLTIGAPVYLAVTPGGLTSTQPTGSADIVRVVGYAIAADEIYFNPSQDWIELV